MAKFTYEEHQKRMRELLKPKGVVSPVEERIKMAIRRRKLPKGGV